MAWAILISAGVLESVWAIALGASDGLKKPVPTLVFVAGCVVSMVGLAVAMRDIPTGTAYAVWVAIGAGLTVAYSLATGQDRASLVRIVLLCTLVGSVVGLKAVS